MSLGRRKSPRVKGPRLLMVASAQESLAPTGEARPTDAEEIAAAD